MLRNANTQGAEKCRVWIFVARAAIDGEIAGDGLPAGQELRIIDVCVLRKAADRLGQNDLSGQAGPDTTRLPRLRVRTSSGGRSGAGTRSRSSKTKKGNRRDAALRTEAGLEQRVVGRFIADDAVGGGVDIETRDLDAG